MTAMLELYSSMAMWTSSIRPLLSTLTTELVFIGLLLYILTPLAQQVLYSAKSKDSSIYKIPLHVVACGVSQLPSISSPIRIPKLGHLLGLQRDSANYINSLISSTSAPLFTIRIPFRTIVVAKPSVDRYLARHVSDTGLAQILAHIGRRVFALGDETIQTILEVDPRHLHRVEFGGPENLRVLTERSSQFLSEEMAKMPQAAEVDIGRWMFQLTVAGTANAVWGKENPWRMDPEFAEEFL